MIAGKGPDVLPLACNFQVLCDTKKEVLVKETNLQEVCKKSNPYTLASPSRWFQSAVDYSNGKIRFDIEQWEVFVKEYLGKFLTTEFKEGEQYACDIYPMDMAMDKEREIYGVLPNLNGLMLFLNEAREKEKGIEFGSTKNVFFAGNIPVLEDDMYFPENPQILSCYHEIEGAFFISSVEKFISDEVDKMITEQSDWTLEQVEEKCASLSSSIQEKYFMLIAE